MTHDLEKVYQAHLARVRAQMTRKQIDFLFLPIGPEFYYLTGSEGPSYHDRMRVWGDWIDGIFLGVEEGPVLIYHSTFSDPLVIEMKETFIMPEDDPDPDATMGRALGTFRTAGKTIATVKHAWAQTMLSLQQAAPQARFVTLNEARLGRDHRRERRIRIEPDAGSRRHDRGDHARGGPLYQGRHAGPGCES